jgi:hypothetical protein
MYESSSIDSKSLTRCAIAYQPPSPLHWGRQLNALQCGSQCSITSLDAHCSFTAIFVTATFLEAKCPHFVQQQDQTRLSTSKFAAPYIWALTTKTVHLQNVKYFMHKSVTHDVYHSCINQTSSYCNIYVTCLSHRFRRLLPCTTNTLLLYRLPYRIFDVLHTSVQSV